MALKAAITLPTNDRDWQRFCLETYDLRVRFGVGSPAGVVVADIGTLYMNTTGAAGTTLWVKESGDGLSSGWASK